MIDKNEFDQKLYDFLIKKHITWDEKKKKWSKPFQPVTKNIWIKSDKGFYNEQKKEKGYWQTTFSHWKMGKLIPKLTVCAYCFKKLEGKQKKYCSHKCRVLASQIRKKADEIGVMIFHSEKRKMGHFQFPEWKDFTIRYPDGTMKPLTTKKGKRKELR